MIEPPPTLLGGFAVAVEAEYSRSLPALVDSAGRSLPFGNCGAPTCLHLFRQCSEDLLRRLRLSKYARLSCPTSPHRSACYGDVGQIAADVLHRCRRVGDLGDCDRHVSGLCLHSASGLFAGSLDLGLSGGGGFSSRVRCFTGRCLGGFACGLWSLVSLLAGLLARAARTLAARRFFWSWRFSARVFAHGKLIVGPSNQRLARCPMNSDKRTTQGMA